MIFTYAIFIPNTGVRAAKLIVPMALAPMAVPWILGLVHPEFYQVAIRAANLEKISEDGLFLLLGAFTAIFGTHTINTLRTEAYDAQSAQPVSAGSQARRRRDGRGLPGGASVAQASLRHQADPPGARRRNQRVFARFEREVRATARLSHWNTIEIFDYGRNDDGAFYYVMEYLPGLSLADLVERYGPMPPARVIYLLRQACDALQRGARVGADPPRHQAGQPDGRLSRRPSRRDQAARFRPGQDALQRGRLDPSLAGRHRRRLAAVHGPRAGHAQPAARPPHRHLRTGGRRLLHADRPSALPRDNRDGSHGRPCPRPGHSAVAAPPRDSRRPGSGRAPLPGQEPADRYPGHAEPRRGPGRLCRRRELVARARRATGGGTTSASTRSDQSRIETPARRA